jgi:hypothetical protein
MVDREKVIKALEDALVDKKNQGDYSVRFSFEVVEIIITLLKDQETVVHPEPSCEMTYITDCCCDLCGVQLIREDKFCRCCGKRIEWESR